MEDALLFACRAGLFAAYIYQHLPTASDAPISAPPPTPTSSSPTAAEESDADDSSTLVDADDVSDLNPGLDSAPSLDDFSLELDHQTLEALLEQPQVSSSSYGDDVMFALMAEADGASSAASKESSASSSGGECNTTTPTDVAESGVSERDTSITTTPAAKSPTWPALTRLAAVDEPPALLPSPPPTPQLDDVAESGASQPDTNITIPPVVKSPTSLARTHLAPVVEPSAGVKSARTTTPNDVAETGAPKPDAGIIVRPAAKSLGKGEEEIAAGDDAEYSSPIVIEEELWIVERFAALSITDDAVVYDEIKAVPQDSLSQHETEPTTQALPVLPIQHAVDDEMDMGSQVEAEQSDDDDEMGFEQVPMFGEEDIHGSPSAQEAQPQPQSFDADAAWTGREVVMTEGATNDHDTNMAEDDSPSDDWSRLQAEVASDAVPDSPMTDGQEIPATEMEATDTEPVSEPLMRVDTPAEGLNEAKGLESVKGQSVDHNGAAQQNADPRSYPIEFFTLAEEFGTGKSAEAQARILLYMQVSRQELEQMKAAFDTGRVSANEPQLTQHIEMIMRRFKLISRYAMVVSDDGRSDMWDEDMVDRINVEKYQQLADEIVVIAMGFCSSLDSSQNNDAHTKNPNMVLIHAKYQLRTAVKQISDAAAVVRDASTTNLDEEASDEVGDGNLVLDDSENTSASATNAAQPAHATAPAEVTSAPSVIKANCKGKRSLDREPDKRPMKRHNDKEEELEPEAPEQTVTSNSTGTVKATTQAKGPVCFLDDPVQPTATYNPQASISDDTQALNLMILWFETSDLQLSQIMELIKYERASLGSHGFTGLLTTIKWRLIYATVFIGNINDRHDNDLDAAEEEAKWIKYAEAMQGDTWELLKFADDLDGAASLQERTNKFLVQEISRALKQALSETVAFKPDEDSAGSQSGSMNASSKNPGKPTPAQTADKKCHQEDKVQAPKAGSDPDYDRDAADHFMTPRPNSRHIQRARVQPAELIRHWMRESRENMRRIVEYINSLDMHRDRIDQLNGQKIESVLTCICERFNQIAEYAKGDEGVWQTTNVTAELLGEIHKAAEVVLDNRLDLNVYGTEKTCPALTKLDIMLKSVQEELVPWAPTKEL